MNRTKIYRGRDRINLTYELYLCDGGNVLSNKYKFLEIGKLLGVKAQTCNETPNKYLNMEDIEMAGRKLMRENQIIIEFSKKIAYLIYPYTQLFTNIIMYKEQRFTSH